MPQANLTNNFTQMQDEHPIKIKRAFSTSTNYETPNKADSEMLIKQS